MPQYRQDDAIFVVDEYMICLREANVQFIADKAEKR